MYIDAITTVYADRAVLAAICEPNPGRAQFYVDEVVGRGIPAPSTWTPERLEEMIAAEHIDRVIITARDDLHADLIVRSLEAGAHVVVEKPPTIDPPRAARIEDAVERTGREAVPTVNYSYSPPHHAQIGRA